MKPEAAVAAVLVEVTGGVGRLTLNVPDRLNAVDTAMLDALEAGVASLIADPHVRVLTITGAGRGFCAGANLAVVGVSLALGCDYVLATESASFVLAFAKIGLMPDGGATALVAASIGRTRAMRMALTGEKVPALTAAQWGLVSETVPDSEFHARGEAVLDFLAASAPAAVAETKSAINAACLELDAALAREEDGQTRLMRSADFREGVDAFLGKRRPTFVGS